MAKTVYDDETKALAIYSLLTGNSYEYVSKEFDIPEGTLKSCADWLISWFAALIPTRH